MLEQSMMRVGPWRCVPGSLNEDGNASTNRWARSIVAASSLAHLGEVVFSSRWPRPRLEIVEAPDDALVFSLRPSWWRRNRWTVRDGEGSQVGIVHRDSLIDPWNQRFAWRRCDGAAIWTLCEWTGREYARWTQRGDGDLLHYLDAGVTNPFLRMLVFASFLLLRPDPSADENK